jgi:hypothetical protein
MSTAEKIRPQRIKIDMSSHPSQVGREQVIFLTALPMILDYLCLIQVDESEILFVSQKT